MHTLTASPITTPLSPAERLQALDDLLHRLWAHEPDCRFGERHHRLNTLRQLSIEVERLAFRQNFHPDEQHLDPGGADRPALDDCIRRTAALAATWSADLWVGVPWPSDLLGERVAGGTS